MAKKITGIIKLQIAAGQANPAPPVGPALGQHGDNNMAFCKEINAKTKDHPGKDFHLYYQIAAGFRVAEKSRRDYSRVQRAQ